MKFVYTHINAFSKKRSSYIFIRGRTREGKRVEIIVHGFWPRFFVKDVDIERLKSKIDINTKIVKIIKWKNTNHPIYKNITKSIYGDEVSLVLVRTQKDIHSKKDDVDYGVCGNVFNNCETFQDDLPLEISFLVWSGIKSGIEIPDEPDKMFDGYPAYHWRSLVPFDDLETEIKIGALDIENYYFRGDDGSEKIACLPITAISMKTFKNETMHQWIYNPENPAVGKYKTKLIGAKNVEYEHRLMYCNSEKSLLENFINKFRVLDHDIDTAWNSKYDLTYIINRSIKNEIDIKKLSTFPFSDEPVTAPNIMGKTIFDSLFAYYKHTFFDGEKHSYKLESVSQEELGVGKIPKIYNDKPITVGALLSCDLKKFIRYNAIDTELVELIAEVKGMWKYLEYTRRRMGVPIELIPHISSPYHALFTREAMMKGMAFATRVEKTEEFKGGVVFDPTPGLHPSAASLDFKSLYANIMYMFNMSLETLIRNPSSCKKEYLDKCIKTPNGLYFKQKSEQRGFISEIVFRFIQDRDRLKEEMLISYEKYGAKDKRTEGLNMAQKYEKANTNSIYGLYPFYNIEISKAITAIAREAITFVKNIVTSEKLVHALYEKFNRFFDIKFLYGDTDSCYITNIDPHDTELIMYIGSWISKEMDGFCAKYNVENYFKLRAEKLFDSFFMFDVKKKYAGHCIYEYKEVVGGGTWKKVDKFEMVGLEKSDISEIGNRAVEDVIKKSCEFASNMSRNELYDWIGAYIREKRSFVYSKKFNVVDICPTKKLTKSIDKYGKTTKTGKKSGIQIHARAADFSNKNLGTSFVSGDKIPILYVNGKITNVIAVPEDYGFRELSEHGFEMDCRKMFKKQIIQKLEPVVTILGWKIEDVIRGIKQLTIDELK